MKKARRLIIAAILLGTALVCYAWYDGFVPVFGGFSRASVRHALNLRILPFGASITTDGVESWTDYIYEADISIPPDRFESLLVGRHFKKQPLDRGPEMTSAYRIEGYHGFEATEIWTWGDHPKDLGPGDYGTYCTVYCNAARDRAFIRFTAD